MGKWRTCTLSALFVSVLASAKIIKQEEEPLTTNYVNSLLDNNTTCKEECLPPEMYLKAYSYMKHSTEFRNFSMLDVINRINGLEFWTAPEELQKKFPYYLSGYDYEDQPVWVGEVGKFNVKEIVERGHDALEELKWYLFQATFRMLKSMQVKDTEKKEIRRVFLLGDWEGLDLSQATHLPTVLFCIEMVRTYLDFLLVGVGYAVSINMAYAAEIGFQIVRPLLGGLFHNIELYGTNKAKWMKALKKLLPPESIPSWYGGKADYKPLQVYG